MPWTAAPASQGRKISTVTDDEQRIALIQLGGSLSVRSIADTRAILLEALARHDTVQVDCSAAESVDLSLIQLLLAARRGASEDGKELTMAAPATGVLLAALEQGGFLPPTGGDPFWTAEP
jgi:ABC-type transporter Mla MlaB component